MTALYLVDKLDIVDGEEIVQWVRFAYSASAHGMLPLCWDVAVRLPL